MSLMVIETDVCDNCKTPVTRETADTFLDAPVRNALIEDDLNFCDWACMGEYAWTRHEEEQKEAKEREKVLAGPNTSSKAPNTKKTTARGPKSRKRRIPCEVCGEKQVPGAGMAAHVRNKHPERARKKVGVKA